MNEATLDPSRPVRHRRSRWLIEATAVVALIVVGCQSARTSPAVPPAPLAGNAAANTAQAVVDTEHAVAMIQRRDYAGARPLLERAIVADPMYGPAHNDLGLVLYHVGRNYEAAWEFERASKLMPRRGEPFNNLGLVYERADKMPEAETAFQSAWDLDPQNSEFAGNLARLRIRRGERDETTRKLLRTVLATDTRAAWVDWARINLYRTPSRPGTTTNP